MRGAVSWRGLDGSESVHTRGDGDAAFLEVHFEGILLAGLEVEFDQICMPNFGEKTKIPVLNFFIKAVKEI